jgi:hypothetical protein
LELGVPVARLLQPDELRHVLDASGIVGVVREDVEERAADDLVAARHRRVRVRVADSDDLKLRRQDEVEPRRGLKERLEIGRLLGQMRRGVRIHADRA